MLVDSENYLLITLPHLLHLMNYFVLGNSKASLQIPVTLLVLSNKGRQLTLGLVLFLHQLLHQFGVRRLHCS